MLMARAYRVRRARAQQPLVSWLTGGGLDLPLEPGHAHFVARRQASRGVDARVEIALHGFGDRDVFGRDDVRRGYGPLHVGVAKPLRKKIDVIEHGAVGTERP